MTDEQNGQLDDAAAGPEVSAKQANSTIIKALVANAGATALNLAKQLSRFARITGTRVDFGLIKIGVPKLTTDYIRGRQWMRRKVVDIRILGHEGPDFQCLVSLICSRVRF